MTDNENTSANGLDSSVSACDLLAKAEELIASGELSEAQSVLDAMNGRTARWHYVQSMLFVKKGWYNEARKQLEIAIQLEPGNKEYVKAYEDLGKNIGKNGGSFKKVKEKPHIDRGACAEICCLTSCECCAEGVCTAICEGCSG